MKPILRIIDRARAAPRRIVLCEAEDARILQAAARATREGIAQVILVGNPARITDAAAGQAIDLAGMTIVDPATSALTPSFAQALHVMRQKKGMTLDQAQQAVLDPLCFANLMVRQGHADAPWPAPSTLPPMWCAMRSS